MIARLRALLFGTLRRQIVVGVALVAALTMALFMWNLALGLRALVLDRQTAISEGLAVSMAESAAGAFAAGDVASMQRLVDAQRHLPQLDFSMLIDSQGRLLAHSDRTQVGQTVRDLPKFTAPATTTVMPNPAAVVADVVSPVMVDGRHVGWARVGLARRVIAAGMVDITRGAIGYALAAILASALIAAFVAARLTRRLRVIQGVAAAVEQGDLAQRASLQGTDEAAQVGRSVDRMLDSLVASREALNESEQRFRLALEAASMETWCWDIATDHTQWSAGQERVLGPRPEGGYPDFRQMVLPQDRDRFLAAARAAMAGAPGYEVEFRFCRTDGEVRWLVTSGRVIRDSQGKPIAMVGVTQDINVRRRAESELVQSRRFLSDLIEHSGAVIFVKDREGRFELVNRKWEEVAGISRDKAMGRTVADLFPAALAEPRRAFDMRAMTTGEPVEVEETWADASGQRYFLVMRFPMRDSDGQIRGVCGMSTEITARKRDELRIQASETRLQAILDAVPECVKVIGPDGTLQQINAAGLVIVESPQDPTPLLGRSVEGLVAPEHRSAFAAQTRRVLDGASGEMEFEIIGLRGTRRWLETRAVPLRDAESGTISMLAVSRDITERKAMQAELLHHRDNLQAMVTERTAELVASRADAERLGQAKSEFLAHMSHEIRTPLNAVLGLTQIGKVESAGSAAEATFERIGQAGRHLLAVINDILDFSRIDAGKLELERRPFALATTLESARSLVAESAHAKGLSLVVTVAPNLPQHVSGDARRLLQILINLLANAIKFTDRGEVRVRVAHIGDDIWFKVIDTGIGMSEEQMARLFQSFEQADRSITRRFGGTGLGLAISYALARQMGGEITVDSALGKGSAFTLRLPLPQAQAVQSGVGELDRPAGSRLAGVRVLAAEDVEVNRLILEAMLTHEGAEVLFAENGQLALDCVARDGADAFDVVLMDVQMPVMDGYVATRELSRLAPGLPVIGLTAHALDEEREKSLAAGMVEHVTKPIDLEALIRAILRQLDGRGSTRH